jgi:hypothetical protein
MKFISFHCLNFKALVASGCIIGELRNGFEKLDGLEVAPLLLSTSKHMLKESLLEISITKNINFLCMLNVDKYQHLYLE